MYMCIFAMLMHVNFVLVPAHPNIFLCQICTNCEHFWCPLSEIQYLAILYLAYCVVSNVFANTKPHKQTV